MKNAMNSFIGIMVLLATSCSPSPSTPEGLLKMFVNDVTTKKVGKDYYLKYTAGELRESLDELSEEEVAQRSFLENVKSAKVDILNKNCQKEKCALTYVVKYDMYSEQKKAFEAETKKLAEIAKIDNKWKITGVTNLKTFYESLDPIEPTNEEGGGSSQK